MRTILKTIDKKLCDTPDWKKTWVMELTFKLRVLVKDLIDNDDDNIIKRVKIEARKYFKNLRNPLIDEKSLNV